MPLISCPSCAHQISDQAVACPQCGHPMATANPYAAPGSSVADPVAAGTDYSALNEVARGQRILLLALLVSIVAAFSIGFLGETPVLLISIVAGLAGIYGLLVMARGLGYSILTRIVLTLGMLVPTLNWLVMLLLCNTANKKLKAAGYKLGLMGAAAR